MATYIIADVHLSNNRPLLMTSLRSFYGRTLINDKVIILGDLFDYYVGLNTSDKLHQELRSIIQAAKHRGVTTYFQRGNRDFLMDKSDASYFGFKLLPDYYVIQTPKGPALIMHGDQLCLNDRSFQKFRRLSKNKILRFIFMRLPYSLRNKIAGRIRAKSQKQNPLRNKRPQTFGMVKKAGIHCLRMSKCRILIHGHFHVFGARKDVFGPDTYRFGLGYWGANFSYIYIDRLQFEIIQKPMERLF